MVRFEKIEKTEDLQHYNITIVCPFCGQQHVVKITSQELFNLNQGQLIQDACRDESPEVRESLVSGMCKQCQKKYF